MHASWALNCLRCAHEPTARSKPPRAQPSFAQPHTQLASCRGGKTIARPRAASECSLDVPAVASDACPASARASAAKGASAPPGFAEAYASTSLPKAHSVLATSCGLSSARRARTHVASARAAGNALSRTLLSAAAIVPSAHATLESACGAHASLSLARASVPMRRSDASAALASASMAAPVSSPPSTTRPDLATAHSALLSSCGRKCAPSDASRASTPSAAACAGARRALRHAPRAPGAAPSFAQAHRMPDTWRGAGSSAEKAADARDASASRASSLPSPPPPRSCASLASL
mmetsp:Transcript_14017/g.58550  ORF Transcript_14017/g.58550 Transcript_14017/m.58550 type:complete len:293 (-) Transcript_14017:131-1009(-)